MNPFELLKNTQAIKEQSEKMQKELEAMYIERIQQLQAEAEKR